MLFLPTIGLSQSDMLVSIRYAVTDRFVIRAFECELIDNLKDASALDWRTLQPT